MYVRVCEGMYGAVSVWLSFCLGLVWGGLVGDCPVLSSPLSVYLVQVRPHVVLHTACRHGWSNKEPVRQGKETQGEARQEGKAR